MYPIHRYLPFIHCHQLNSLSSDSFASATSSRSYLICSLISKNPVKEKKAKKMWGSEDAIAAIKRNRILGLGLEFGSLCFRSGFSIIPRLHSPQKRTPWKTKRKKMWGYEDAIAAIRRKCNIWFGNDIAGYRTKKSDLISIEVQS